MCSCVDDLQGLYQLLEENVTIRCRKEDVNVVEVCQW